MNASLQWGLEKADPNLSGYQNEVSSTSSSLVASKHGGKLLEGAVNKCKVWG